MPIDIAALRARKKPRQQTVTLILDPDIEEQLVTARDERTEAQARADRTPGNSAAAADLAAANERVEQAEAAARDESVTFVFKALGREAYEQMKDAHRPTKKQRDDYKAKGLAMGFAEFQVGDLGYNLDTFPPALVAASCIEPEMTLDDAQALWDSDEFSSAELGDLFAAAMTVNETSRRIDLGKG